MLERMIKIYQSAGYVDFANTPEGDEGRRKLNDEVYPPKTGFFRAFYSRSGDGEESFQYSPNPAVAELAKVTLKENGNRNYNGDLRSDLILATKNGDVHKIRELLARGANVNWKDSQGETPLMQAADLSTVRLLLEEGANVDDKNNYGFTALIRASSLGLSSVVKALLEKGANVDSKNKYGNTALMSAAMKGYIEVVEILLGKGADPAATNNIGKTAMMFARERDYEEIVRRLKAAGADK
jgi:ankyrin repeat protein